MCTIVRFMLAWKLCWLCFCLENKKNIQERLPCMQDQQTVSLDVESEDGQPLILPFEYSKEAGALSSLTFILTLNKLS